jgi:hypothetical protein
MPCIAGRAACHAAHVAWRQGPGGPVSTEPRPSRNRSSAARRSSACVSCAAGPCARCEVVCTDPALGRRTGPEPLRTLATFRRVRGRIHFGLLLETAPPPPGAPPVWVAVGAPVQASLACAG